jgi:hypothetical protein
MKRENIPYILVILVLLLVVFILGALLIFNRSSAPEVDLTPTQDAAVVQTSIAQTVEAALTESSANAPIATEVMVEDCNCPTAEPTEAALEDESTATPTEASTAVPTIAATVPATFAYHAEFVLDVTVSDGTQFNPSDVFSKTWRIRNIGSEAWTTDFAIVFIDGERMDGDPQFLPNEVASGESIDLTVGMVAPAIAGEYQGFWMITDGSEEGTVFGVGADAQQALFVLIEVLAHNSTVTLSVDQADVVSVCPYTFTFTVDLSGDLATEIAWQFEATDTSDDSQLHFAGPFASTLAAANDIVSEIYSLTLDADASGSAVAEVIQPENVVSDPVAFSLTCEVEE